MERGGDCHECKIGVRGLCPLWEAQIWREQGIGASLHSDAIHTLWGTVVCAQSTLQSRHRNWDEVPQYLTSRFYNTRELDLTGSRVRDMGDLVERFVLLESLAAPENELAVLPDSLGDLRHLESLDVSRNHLQELPDSLLKLTDLLKLHATGNDLTAVPDLGPLTKLLDLDLSMNQIHDQPEWLDKLTSLKTLDLSRNLIDGRLTSAACALAELETLKLRRNLLDGLPDCMGDLISLDDLDLQERPRPGEQVVAGDDPGRVHTRRQLRERVLRRGLVRRAALRVLPDLIERRPLDDGFFYGLVDGPCEGFGSLEVVV
ncbi:hypothetical protein AURANDRAFT_33877 [Aureococcus anophagefferens]|uniref:Leucine-rich repeat domain-containing protein n=1 Tax=Aureococcus anophagefferens TaxID=44056 RepID=F0YMX1_AURAN|nr:hypothetical protein AURANDRAFT_33877 [Aureococcus anophagefferens]EGB03542.1 hypothetical protein AURANDRAFT_33877 [Aureococcus anophagefferens]|eukprot:XP_009041757.1 hypothetical protein AURANDRAFT_33877 [Aureococcus anophagefferens]